jgi:hypothetical protein
MDPDARVLLLQSRVYKTYPYAKLALRVNQLK